MSEPVGNQSRSKAKPGGDMSAIAGNSHKTRTAAEAEVATVAESPDKAEKMVEGKVVTRKMPWWKKFASSMVADDAQNVGDYILTDVVVPSARRLIVEIVEGAVNRVIFGTSRARRTSGFGTTSLRHVPYDRLSDRGVERDPRRGISQAARARHDFDEVVLETREEAVIVIDALIDRVSRYGATTVADLYDILGVTGSYVDQKWGWTDLITADVRQVRGGFLLDLPRPEPIR